MKATIEIDNITSAQYKAIEEMFYTWGHLASLGSSRWVSFFADGDGNFHPKITIDGKRPQDWAIGDWVKDEYFIDFDVEAWRESNA